MLTHLLDTSAWLAHLQREPGWETVSQLLADEEAQVGISALSLVELHARLRATGREDSFEVLVEEYREVLALIAPVTEDVALRTIALRRSSTSRVPAIDAMIAATAAHHQATLVHRDPHFGGLPPESVTQLPLGETAP